MSERNKLVQCVFTALAIAALPMQAAAEAPDPALFDLLAQESGDGWIEAEAQILRAWAETGSEPLNMIQLRGESALDEGDYKSAIGHLTALVDHAPDHAMGWQMRAMAYWLNGNYGPAAADLAQALTLEPKQYLALTQLATMLEELGDTPRALEAIRRSLDINPHQPDAIDAAARLEQTRSGTDI
ncbi:MAG: tetratricopeptide repeat protein [Paracoccus sp. (in: a-proteobacteria)]|nr:tetratricopeptide repeat protein [Paracoccus sp. (in: a-proteobacteria)]